MSKETKLKNFPRIVFNEDININMELDYEIIELDEMNLYGIALILITIKLVMMLHYFLMKPKQSIFLNMEK